MNVVILTGRLTDKPNYVAEEGKVPKADFTLAVARDGNGNGTDFIHVICFHSTANFVNQYFDRGMKIEVRGRWQSTAKTRSDGNTSYYNDCIAEKVYFGESKRAFADYLGENDEHSNDGFMPSTDDLDSLPFR